MLRKLYNKIEHNKSLRQRMSVAFSLIEYLPLVLEIIKELKRDKELKEIKDRLKSKNIRERLSALRDLKDILRSSSH